jgi:AraC-like DNA-binding protein
MRRNDEIPVFKKNFYNRHYFRHDYIEQKPLSAEGQLQQFAIHQRCMLKTNIEPHRLNFYAVFLVTEGEGIHTFGLQQHYIKKNMLCFIGPNMIRSWKTDVDEQRGFFCSFSGDFFNFGKEDKTFLHSLPFFHIEGNGVLHLTDEQADYYLTLLRFMKTEYENKNSYSDNILRSQLHVLINKAYSQFRKVECRVNTANQPGLNLVKRFREVFMRDINRLSEGKGIHLKKVSDYAQEIGVSQNHLNDTIKGLTGVSAGQMIKDQLIKQATMCLKYSSKSIGEIAYTLGFEDPSYFARYYKLRTGQSPSAFR